MTMRGPSRALAQRPWVVRGGFGEPATAASAPDPAGTPVPPDAPMLAWYTNRTGYLMAIGRPAAQVGLVAR